MPRPTESSSRGPADREREVADLLDEWPWSLGAVLIGGYAVAAHGLARYSDDVDFVIGREACAAHGDFLRARGYRDRALNVIGARPGGPSVERWERQPVTLDFLIGGVRDRRAGIEIPVEWIAANPWRGRLLLLDAATRVEVSVCRPSALFALKLIAARAQDLADLFTMAQAPVDPLEIRAVLGPRWSEAAAVKFEEASRSAADPTVFRDICAKRAMGSPASRENVLRWRLLQQRIEACRPRAK